MPRGDKSSYSDKQKRQAEHIEESEKSEGRSSGAAKRIAWATVNKQDGGAKKSGTRKKTTKKAAKKSTRKTAAKKTGRKVIKKSTRKTAKKAAKKTGRRAAKKTTRKVAKKTTKSARKSPARKKATKKKSA